MSAPSQDTIKPQSPQRELAHTGAVRVFEYQCPLMKGAPVEPEQFSFAAVSLVRTGTFGFRSDGAPQVLSAGFVLLANPGQQYEISHEHAELDRCIIFRFEEAIIEETLGRASIRGPRRYFARSVLPPSPRIEALRSLAEHQLAAGGSRLGLEGLAVTLVTDVAASLGRAPKAAPGRDSRATRDLIHAALAQIERSSTEEVTLIDLARSAGMSPFHFLRVFRRETGVTPHRFLIQTRVRRAIDLLRDTTRPVTDIAFDVGFGDASNFTNTFRREVGCSPARFRRASPDGRDGSAASGLTATPRATARFAKSATSRDWHLPLLKRPRVRGPGGRSPCRPVPERSRSCSSCCAHPQRTPRTTWTPRRSSLIRRRTSQTSSPGRRPMGGISTW